MSRGVDRVSLVSGLVLIGLGTVLLFDQTGAFDLSPGLLGAALAAAVGVILLASGIGEPAQSERDEEERERDPT